MSTGASFESFEKELNRLVESFGKRIVELKHPSYVEAQLRDDFLNPFFRALGWDMENRAGLIQKHREVEIESRTEIAGRKKRADYLFRTDTHDRFVCEAKKPAEELNAKYAFQTKRYAWNKNLPLAVLSDFEEFKIYVVGGKPHMDEPLVGLWKTWHFRELPLVAREIWNLLARDNVAAGSIGQLLESLPKTAVGKGKARQQWLIKPDRSLDADFLNFLDEARRELAADLLKNNDREDLLEGNKLNEAVQHILDRLLFLRICEDRDIDTGVLLVSIVETWRRNFDKEDEGRRAHQKPLELREEPPADFGSSGIRAPKDSLWRVIVRHFRALDRRPPSHVPYFNGNLFKPHLSEELIVSDEWLAGFVADLSDDESPYLFAYIAVEILGTIYERFLGKTVRPQGRGVTIEEKPEVRKAGGVYYTPRYIVEYIVKQTVEKLLCEISSPRSSRREEAQTASASGKDWSLLTSAATAKDFEKRTLALRFLDPACGSGSFLLRVFEAVCEHWQQWLTDHPGERKKKWCWVDAATGDVHLTMSLKRQILTSNVFGVDLDPGAVEVTQLSLYLKMLENENRNTLQRQRELLPDDDDPLLPPLENNIKCFNSLIGSDFSMMAEDLVRVNAQDWDINFPAIIKSGGFDAVVGNPPYVLIEDGEEKKYLRRNYESDEGKPDLYKYFLEKSHRLMRNEARFGMIIPASLLKTPAYKSCRAVLLKLTSPKSVVVFNGSVFNQASVNCIVLITEKGAASDSVEWIEDDASLPSETSLRAAATKAANLNLSVWRQAADKVFLRPETTKSSWLKKVTENSVPLGSLGSYTLGMQVYHNTVHTKAEMEQRISHAEKPGKGIWLRESRGTNVTRYQFLEEMKEWVEYGTRCYHQPGKEFSKGGRIVIREITGETLVCAYTDTEHMPNKAVIVFRSDTANLKFILGILNSRLIAKFVEATTEKGKQRLFPRISLRSVRTMPIPKIDFSKPADKSRHDKLVLLVDKMLGLMPKLRAATAERERATLQNAVTATDQQIDALVYELYGLTPAEIKLVEGAQ
jgi:hypothetical protein